MKGETKGWIKVGVARPSHFLRFKITTILLLLSRSPRVGGHRFLHRGDKDLSASLPRLGQPGPSEHPHQTGGSRNGTGYYNISKSSQSQIWHTRLENAAQTFPSGPGTGTGAGTGTWNSALFFVWKQSARSWGSCGPSFPHLGLYSTIAM